MDYDQLERAYHALEERHEKAEAALKRIRILYEAAADKGAVLAGEMYRAARAALDTEG